MEMLIFVILTLRRQIFNKKSEYWHITISLYNNIPFLISSAILQIKFSDIHTKCNLYTECENSGKKCIDMTKFLGRHPTNIFISEYGESKDMCYIIYSYLLAFFSNQLS